MKLDRYNLYARIFPATICVSPIFTFSWFFLGEKIIGFFQSVYMIKWIGNISIPLIFIILLSQVNRLISKEIFEKFYFKGELEMPTTNFLMRTNDQYSTEYKEQIYSKIFKDFGIILLSFRAEKVNPILARKKISEAVGQIRRRVGKGVLLHQHNIEYGFFRNLIGGSFIATILSLIDILFFSFLSPNILALKISILTFILFLIPLVFSKKILSSLGTSYAKVLIQEYMSIGD